MKCRYIIGFLSFLVVFSTSMAATTAPLNPPPQVKPSSINLNTADVKILSKSFKGIGVKRAQAIVKYREAHQGFKSVAELANVPGIGKKFFDLHKADLEKIFTVK